MLPGEDGLVVCRIVRPYHKGPILMLTARTEDLMMVLGLEMGQTTTSQSLSVHDVLLRAFAPAAPR